MLLRGLYVIYGVVNSMCVGGYGSVRLLTDSMLSVPTTVFYCSFTALVRTDRYV